MNNAIFFSFNFKMQTPTVTYRNDNKRITIMILSRTHFTLLLFLTFIKEEITLMIIDAVHRGCASDKVLPSVVGLW